MGCRFMLGLMIKRLAILTCLAAYCGSMLKNIKTQHLDAKYYKRYCGRENMNRTQTNTQYCCVCIFHKAWRALYQKHFI